MEGFKQSLKIVRVSYAVYEILAGFKMIQGNYAGDALVLPLEILKLYMKLKKIYNNAMNPIISMDSLNVLAEENWIPSESSDGPTQKARPPATKVKLEYKSMTEAELKAVRELSAFACARFERRFFGSDVGAYQGDQTRKGDLFDNTIILAGLAFLPNRDNTTEYDAFEANVSGTLLRFGSVKKDKRAAKVIECVENLLVKIQKREEVDATKQITKRRTGILDSDSEEEGMNEENNNLLNDVLLEIRNDSKWQAIYLTYFNEVKTDYGTARRKFVKTCMDYLNERKKPSWVCNLFKAIASKSLRTVKNETLFGVVQRILTLKRLRMKPTQMVASYYAQVLDDRFLPNPNSLGFKEEKEKGKEKETSVKKKAKVDPLQATLTFGAKLIKPAANDRLFSKEEMNELLELAENVLSIKGAIVERLDRLADDEGDLTFLSQDWDWDFDLLEENEEINEEEELNITDFTAKQSILNELMGY